MQHSHGSSLGANSPKKDGVEAKKKSLSIPSHTPVPQPNGVKESDNFPNQRIDGSVLNANESGELLPDDPKEKGSIHDIKDTNPITTQKSTVSNGPERNVQQSASWGRTPANKKNISVESIDLSSDDEVEIQKLEATKIELLNRIAEEVKGNADLFANLEKRKDVLHEFHLTLEQDVARLQEQLQKERELRMLLETGLESCQWPLTASATIDEKVPKMEAELEGVAQAGFNVITLKQNANDVGVQLNQQHELNTGYSQDLCKEPEQTSNHQAKLKDKQKDFGTIAGSLNQERTRRTKGSNSTTSALSKLTNRLNFLKERRTQISNELHNMEKGRNSSQPVQNPDKGKGSECQSSEKNANSDEDVPAEGLSTQNIQAKNGRKSDGQSFPNMERGKSESFSNTDGGRPVGPTRMFSR